MEKASEYPNLAFIWRLRDLTPLVSEAAHSTKTCAIVDLSTTPIHEAATSISGALGFAADINAKISEPQLFDHALEDFVERTGIRNLWIELHPFSEKDPISCLRQMISHKSKMTFYPILGDINLIRQILSEFPQLDHLVLKGSEASGFVSSASIFTLFSFVMKTVSAKQKSSKILIWGGIGTPEAAAAFLSAGVKGIVFESVHWLTSHIGIDAAVRDKISKLQPYHSELVGLDLQVPCRLFNKGNSKAVKHLKQSAGSVCGDGAKEEQQRFFYEHIQNESVHPLESTFKRDEVIPLGLDTGFASSFVDRFGSDITQAIERFKEEIEIRCNGAEKIQMSIADSPVAREMGTEFPFIQGAMTWITDKPEFAREIAEAGGLPTIALGMMNRELINRRLGNLQEIMEPKPYAINVICLAENPYRDEQLDWILKIKPRFVVLAAGEPRQPKKLHNSGIDVIYIAPNEEMLKLAFKEGIRYVICEGNEAGGHVGKYSTLTFSQIVHDLKWRKPDLFADRRIILAGGIFNRETAFIATMLGADVLQMGTAYLGTEEIVKTGALTDLYQRLILESEPDATTVTGERTGLRVRSLRTPKIEAICSLERDFASSFEEEGAFRRKIEALSAGSLLVASRGIDPSDGSVMDEDSCFQQGQFMSGASAGLIDHLQTVKALHNQLAHAPLPSGLPVLNPFVQEQSLEDGDTTSLSNAAFLKSPIQHEIGPERIVITGMSIVNALGNHPRQVWENSLALKSGITHVSPVKWDHEDYYDPNPRTPEKTYCKVAAFQQFEVTRKELGIPPQDFRTMSNSTRGTLWLARQAIEDAAIMESDIPRERVGVFVSQNSGEAAATMLDIFIRGEVGKLISSIKNVIPLARDVERNLAVALKSGRLAIDDTTLLGRLNCAAAGFISNMYGFMGPSFAVSAACASSLAALFSAYQMIRTGVLDAAIIGGAEELLTPMHFQEFSAIGALAGISGVERPPGESSRPFDAGRDGMVLGEGGGIIVIEKYSTARKRHARIYGYINSMGASNSNTGMVESSRETQKIAMKSSFRDSFYGPDEVDLVECHATATMQGDVEEVQALKALFKNDRPTVLTSFKSQIGHTLGASGVNNLIRGLMAAEAGVFPPTLNYQTPDPEIGLEDAGFLIHCEPVDWKVAKGGSRKIQVNAFGFGGSNYVLQVEHAAEKDDRVLVSPFRAERQNIDTDSQLSLPDGVYYYRTKIGDHHYRLGIAAEKESEAVSLLNRVGPIKSEGRLSSHAIRLFARQGLHLGCEDQDLQPLAFVFPGQGAYYSGMGHELYENFPIIREWIDRFAQVADYDLLEVLFNQKEDFLLNTRWQQPALFSLEYAMARYLSALGIRPTALAGHSLGELTALCLAEVYSFEEGYRIVDKRAVCMAKAGKQHEDSGIMVATDAPLDFLKELLVEPDSIYIANVNSPNQVVFGGESQACQTFSASLKKKGFRCTQLKVSMAFHSPLMSCIHDELEEFISHIEFQKPRIPVISNTTMKPYPEDPEGIKAILMAHLESPVYWMQNIQTLYDQFGIRFFVEVGPRGILSDLISDTIDLADCIQTCLPSNESFVLRKALAKLYANGHIQPGIIPSLITLPGQPKPKHAMVYSDMSTVSENKHLTLSTGSIEEIIQREINSFILDSFGRYLRPKIFSAAKKELSSRYTEKQLDCLLQQTFSDGSVPEVLTKKSETKEFQEVSVTPAIGATYSDQKIFEIESDDITESVIRIIMEATGYDRDEIEPEMDLREDLSIRSSRLPVILDLLENHFGIKIEFKAFMDTDKGELDAFPNIRTVRDLAEIMSNVVQNKAQGHSNNSRSNKTVLIDQHPKADDILPEEPVNTKRIIFKEVPLKEGEQQTLELNTKSELMVLSTEGSKDLVEEIVNVFHKTYSVRFHLFTFQRETHPLRKTTLDLQGSQRLELVIRKLSKIDSLAGFVLVLNDDVERKMNSIEQIQEYFKETFIWLKAFFAASPRKFALLIHRTDQFEGLARVFSEGLHAMFLCLAHEYPTTLFRVARIDFSTPIQMALSGILDGSQKVVEMIYHNKEAFTTEGQVVPLRSEESSGFKFHENDVVVLSGGGYGVTSYLARPLIGLGCKFVFLGRTRLEPVLPAGSTEQDKTKSGITKEVLRTLGAFKALGAEVSYYTCDVNNSVQTRAVLKSILNKYGRIDAIIHGAGILRDSLMESMTLEDFSDVFDVKFIGAWNLYEGAKKHGLRYFVCLSSATAALGNHGQVNYAAGNRAMSALMQYLDAMDNSLSCKSIMLAPIEGAGMVENPETKAGLKRMNVSFLHTEELGELFMREIQFSKSQDTEVLLMRDLPIFNTVRVKGDMPVIAAKQMSDGNIIYEADCFPMIDRLKMVDLRHKEITAEKVFRRERDLWIKDHKPFKFLKHPIVSAVMILESFMEAAKILFPHLEVRGIRNANFFDFIECPLGVKRLSEIVCKGIQPYGNEVICELTLLAGGISPSGRNLKSLLVVSKASVVLRHDGSYKKIESKGFPINSAELDTRLIKRAEIIRGYEERSDLQGRYRLMEEFVGTGKGVIKGNFIYPEHLDFADFSSPVFQYSPYLLEALMQTTSFYVNMKDENEKRVTIPHRIGEMLCFRRCRSGEKVTVEARMTDNNEKGMTWTARGEDVNGKTVMYAKNIHMSWFLADPFLTG